MEAFITRSRQFVLCVFSPWFSWFFLLLLVDCYCILRIVYCYWRDEDIFDISCAFYYYCYYYYYYYYTHLTVLCPGLPRWAGTRKVKPVWMPFLPPNQRVKTLNDGFCFLFCFILSYLLPCLPCIGYSGFSRVWWGHRVTTFQRTRFPDFSSRAGKDSLIYCLMLWSTVFASH